MTQKQAIQTVFMIYVISYLIYLLVGSYYVHKAGNLVGNKHAVRNILIFFGVIMVVLISLTGFYYFGNYTENLC